MKFIHSKYYEYLIIFLAFLSIIFVVLDFSAVINLNHQPFSTIDNGILAIFTIDYFTRFYYAENKWTFFKRNIFDLLAIIPFYSLFSFLKFTRVFRVARLTQLARLSRLIGLTGKLTKKADTFLKTNGFINVLYLSVILIVISSVTYSIAEGETLSNSIWWAIVTATTVGYGDISPVTPFGKTAAIILMFLGIGFIGFLTSTITKYFSTNQENQENTQLTQLSSEIDLLIKKIDQLETKIEELEDHHK